MRSVQLVGENSLPVASDVNPVFTSALLDI